MTDIQTLWNTETGYGDWQLVGTDLLAGDDLGTAVLISLFTDGQAGPNDIIPDGTNDRRGWCGDLGQDIRIGSRLWLLDRAKQTTATLLAAENYAAEALQWLLNDGVVAKIDIAAQWVRQSFLGLEITLYQQDGTKRALKYAWAWKELN